MRSIMLLPALAAVAGVLALVPAGAAGLKHHRGGLRNAALPGGCHLTLEAPSRITVGEGLTLQGRLICRGAAGVAGSQIKVVAKSPPARRHGAVVAGTTTTEGNGVFHFTPASPTVNTGYTVR